MNANDSPNEKHRDDQPSAILARWERWAAEGKTDELLADGAEVLGPHFSDAEYIQQMFHAAVGHDARALAALLVALGATVDESDTGYTPLHGAITSPESGGMVAWLIQQGANPDTLIHGESPLHLAVRQDNIKAVNQLIQCGANINATDIDYYRTPLELAASLGRVEITALLFASRAHVNASRIEQIAAKRSKDQIMRIIQGGKH